MNLAFYGTLRDPEILARVSGLDLGACYQGTKSVSGWACYHIEGTPYPLLLAARDHSTAFSLYQNCPEAAWQRLVDYEGDEYSWVEIEIDGAHYRVFVAVDGTKTAYVPWDLEAFQAGHKAEYMRSLNACC